MEENIKQEEQINPEDIVFNEVEDEEMPEPKTEKYEKNSQDGYVSLTYTFMKLFNDCLGKLPYASTLTNGNDSIKLIDLIKFVEVKQNRISINELNTILNFIANCQFDYVRPLMETVEDKEKQNTLWSMVE